MDPSPPSAHTRALRPGRLAAILIAGAATAGLAACAGGSDDGGAANADTDPPATEETSAERGADGVRPEIRSAIQEVIAHLRAEGARPDREAAARALDEFDASMRLLLPAGGPECRVREIAAGSPTLVRFVQRAPIFDETVTNPSETVAVALDLPNADPGSPASQRCIEAATTALATFDAQEAETTAQPPPGPQESPPVAVRGSGVTTSTGGPYTGALVQNTGTTDLVGVEVGFDILDRAGKVIGAGRPIRLPVLPRGTVAAAGSNATATECGCEVGQIAAVRPRVRVEGELEEAREPETVTDPSVELRAGELVISGTLENPGSRAISDPLISYVLLDANGMVMTGNVALLDVRVPEGGSAPFEAVAPDSLLESLPRPAVDVRVSVT